MATGDHYTITIEVSQTIAARQRQDDRTRQMVEVPRKVNEVARFVVRSDSLEAAVEKAGKHLALVDTGEDLSGE